MQALTFKPYGRRRQWFLRFESAEEQKAWKGTFEYAARNAGPPLNPDVVMRFAFCRAYRETRWRLGVWGWFSFDRTEDEQLGQVYAARARGRRARDSVAGARR